jgi:predicted lipoprotein with Yx(FWY)xxD motif
MSKKMIVASGFALALALGACGTSNDDNAKNNATSNTKTAPAAATRSTTPSAPPATVAVARSDKGDVLVDANGRTLYRFDKDKSGVSNCAGTCAQTWPPLVLETGTAAPVTGDGVQGPLSVIARSDGGRQVADNGRPLYRYAGDVKAGATNGDGIGGVWHVVTIGAAPAATSPSAPTSRGY